MVVLLFADHGWRRDSRRSGAWFTRSQRGVSLGKSRQSRGHRRHDLSLSGHRSSRTCSRPAGPAADDWRGRADRAVIGLTRSGAKWGCSSHGPAVTHNPSPRGEHVAAWISPHCSTSLPSPLAREGPAVRGFATTVEGAKKQGSTGAVPTRSSLLPHACTHTSHPYRFCEALGCASRLNIDNALRP